MHHVFRDSLSAGLQHRVLPPDSRQQQQDNGTREFQPQVQQGDPPTPPQAAPWACSPPVRPVHSARPGLRLAS